MLGRGGNNGNTEVGQLKESNKKLQEAYEEAMIKNLKYRVRKMSVLVVMEINFTSSPSCRK